MSNALFITSSIFGENSKSREVALDLLQHLQADDPGTNVTQRDVNAIPHLSAFTLGALMTPAEQRSADQRNAVAFADSLIAEIEAADTVVIAAPMYNFTIPSSLKAWIDHIARAGRTFRYTAAGAEGLLKGKKVFVVTSRGGFYAEGPAKPMDFEEPYLRSMLRFLGLTDVTFIHAEGLNINAEAAVQGMRKARETIARLTPEIRAAA